jgi:hypothetical protein
VGVAVRLTLWPEHILLPPLEVMLTAGIAGVVTVMVIELEVAVVVLTQLALLVISTVITSPLTKAEDE